MSDPLDKMFPKKPVAAPAIRREYYISESKQPSIQKGRSDKMRATSWVWFSKGYGHAKGNDQRAVLNLIRHLLKVFPEIQDQVHVL